MTEFLWFIGGALAYKALSALLKLGQVSLVVKEIQINVIKFLGTTVQEISYIHNLKYKVMAESNCSKEEIKAAKLLDELDYTAWKKEVVTKLHSSVPKIIAANLSFQNWQDVVNILDRYYKNEK
jgi:hypothetical protein